MPFTKRYLEKKGKKGWETDKLPPKKCMDEKFENFCLTYIFSPNGRQIEKKLCIFKDNTVTDPMTSDADGAQNLEIQLLWASFQDP